MDISDVFVWIVENSQQIVITGVLLIAAFVYLSNRFEEKRNNCGVFTTPNANVLTQEKEKM